MKQISFYYTVVCRLVLSDTSPLLSLLFFVTFLFTSCNSNDTSNEVYGISATLSWADPADAGREIKNVKVWIFQASGKLVSEREYSSKFLTALDIHPLPVGEYDVVAAVNLIRRQRDIFHIVTETSGSFGLSRARPLCRSAHQSAEGQEHPCQSQTASHSLGAHDRSGRRPTGCET